MYDQFDTQVKHHAGVETGAPSGAGHQKTAMIEAEAPPGAGLYKKGVLFSQEAEAPTGAGLHDSNSLANHVQEV